MTSENRSFGESENRSFGESDFRRIGLSENGRMGLSEILNTDEMRFFLSFMLGCDFNHQICAIVHSLSSGKVAATPILKSVPSQFSPFIL